MIEIVNISCIIKLCFIYYGDDKMYINRLAEKRVLKISQTYPVVMVCGPRQVGKSTMIHHIKEPDRKVVSLDDPNEKRLAVEDPMLFIQSHNYPLVIDEFQYAPDLLQVIKLTIDQKALNGEDTNGMYWLTGSQQFRMMKNVSESLAGRVGIIDLSGFSSAEIEKRDIECFHPSLEQLKIREEQMIQKDIHQIYENIFKGGMPKLIVNQLDREEYYNNYIRTYLDRDIRDLAQVGNEIAFYNYLTYLAARTGQELNYSDASKVIGVSAPTIKSWTSILVSTGIIFLLQPYNNNLTKRLVKTPKLYFMDTGLCAFLAKWPTSELLENGAMDGAYLETYVISEIVKSYYNSGKMINFYYYRDFDQKEIDLLFVEGDKIYPVEIKKNFYPSNADKNYDVLKKFKLNIQTGIILCMVDRVTPLNKHTWLCPISFL